MRGFEGKVDPILLRCLNDNIAGVMNQIKKAKEEGNEEKMKCYSYHLSILNEKLAELASTAQFPYR